MKLVLAGTIMDLSLPENASFLQYFDAPWELPFYAKRRQPKAYYRKLSGDMTR